MSLNNDTIRINGKEYKLLYEYDDRVHTYGDHEEIKDKTDMEEMFYFYSSYKNQLTYFNKDKTIVIFCIDYRYGFNYEHKLSELCLYVDEYCLYKQAI